MISDLPYPGCRALPNGWRGRVGGATQGAPYARPRERSRPVLQRAGAEGATAPETLRQKDRRRKGALESGGPVVADPAAHRRSKPRPIPDQGGGLGESLRVHDRGGTDRTRCRARSLCRRRARLSSTDTVPLRRTPLYDLHRRARRAAWCRFAGYDMPVQYPAGIIAEHLHTRAQAGLFDVSHMGQVRLRGADGRRGAGGAGARRHRGAGAGADALHAAAQRRRRHPRRSDGDDRRERATVPGRQRRRARRRTSRICAPRSTTASRSSRCRPRAAGAAGPAGGRGAGAASCRQSSGMPFMSAAEAAIRRRTAASSPAPAIPARTGSRFRCAPGDAAEIAGACSAEPEVEPIGLGARDSPAARSRALPLRPRHRRDHDPDRGRSRLGDRQAAPRARAAFPAPPSILRQLADGPRAQARRHPPRRPRPGARAHRDPRRSRRARSARSPAAASARASTAPIAMGYVDAAQRRPPAPPLSLVVRGMPRPAQVAPLPFVPHRYHRPR